MHAEHTENSDYSPVMTTVVFGPGEVTAMVNVSIIDDTVLEEDEMFSATLTSDQPNVVVQANSSNAVVTIRDYDRKSYYRWHVNQYHLHTQV